MSAPQRQNDKRDRFEDYVPVSERVEKFYERFPDGRITTSIVEHVHEAGFILIRAEVYRSPDDAQPSATGHAYEVKGESYVNKTSYVENAETSAVGRALALLGFEVKRGIASREEMQKTTRQESAPANVARMPEKADEVKMEMNRLRSDITAIFAKATREKNPQKTYTDSQIEYLLDQWTKNEFNNATFAELSLTELRGVFKRFSEAR
jgi:hypothetical protein